MTTAWFEGVDALNSLAVALESDSHDVALKAATVVRAGAARVERLGKQFCPVDTGNLRSSISTDFLGWRGAEVAAEVGPTASYGGFVEWGTERMAPHAYMGPAADIVGPDFEAALLAIPDPLGSGP